MQQIALSSRTSLPSLFADEICYRLLKAIHGRAARAPESMGAFCGLSSDLITHRLMATGAFERSQFEALDALVAADFAPLADMRLAERTFIDVGANIGLFTNRFARYFRTTLAIEPNPITFALLTANIAIAAAPNVRLANCAASSQAGVAQLDVLPRGNLGWSRLMEHAPSGGGERTIEVPLERIDALLERHKADGAVGLIKIDVEGHELNVLRGGEACLRRDGPVVLYEKNADHGADSCAGYLRSLGYNRFYVFQRRGRTPFANTTVSAREIDPDAHPAAALICAVR